MEPQKIRNPGSLGGKKQGLALSNQGTGKILGSSLSLLATGSGRSRGSREDRDLLGKRARCLFKDSTTKKGGVLQRD